MMAKGKDAVRSQGASAVKVTPRAQTSGKQSSSPRGEQSGREGFSKAKKA